jgi:hypothetical protein
MNGQQFSDAQHAGLYLNIYVRISLFFLVVERAQGYPIAAQTVFV